MFGKIVDVRKEGQSVKIQFEQQEGVVTVIDSKTLHFYAACGGPYMESKAVMGNTPSGVDFIVTREQNDVKIETSYLIVKIFEEFKVTIYDRTGKILCRDYTGNRTPQITVSEESLELMRKEGHQVSTSKEQYKIEIVKEMNQTQAIYGLGDRTGFLNKKGYSYELWNTDNPMPHVDSFKTLYKCIPFFIVMNQDSLYGIFMDNPCRSFWDFGKENSEYYYFAVEEGNLNYYFFAGDTMKEIVFSYTEMTGTVPLPQMWALGYQQSRWGYENSADILEVAKKMRQHEIPCDAIHFDIDYMEKFKVFTFDQNKFEKPKEIMNSLAGMGYKPVVIIDPGVKVEKGYSVYEEGKKNGYFVLDSKRKIYENVVWPGDSVYPDFGREEVRAWWGDLEKYLTDLGVRGIWNDMNEPASFQGEIPDDVIFYDEEKESTHAKMHNVYGHLMSKAAFDGLKKHDGRRPFVITRACYAGSQRYATAWTGDNHSIWSHLQMAIPQLCNLGLSGMGFVGTDIGGFGSDTTPELLCRWVQVGSFSPLCRNHSSKGWLYQEPWQFDAKTCEIYKKFIDLRYHLLPYLYDCFYQMSKTGAPVFRPLVFEFEKDPNVWELNDEFMVGDNLLISPVVTQGVNKKLVYLPEGSWVDYETGETHEGGQYFIKDAPIETCPIYVLGGTILPTYPIQQYVGEKEITELILHVYPGEGNYLHYQDDGTGFAYQEGSYNLYEFKITEEGVFSAKRIVTGYEKGYQSFRIRYQGREVVVPVQEEMIVKFV